MTTNPDYLAILFAIWRAGLVAVPANANLHARELAYIVEDCGARLCLATADVAAPLAETLPRSVLLVVLGEKEWRDLSRADESGVTDPGPEAPRWIFYSS